jgi:hypothetical protein
MLGPVQGMLSGVPTKLIPSVEKELQALECGYANVKVERASRGIAATRSHDLVAGGGERRMQFLGLTSIDRPDPSRPGASRNL